MTHDGRSAEDGEQGQIVIRTDRGKPLGLFKEYYRASELTEDAWHDGIYYTGDVAWRDEDGYFWFVGRADDVIKSSGYRLLSHLPPDSGLRISRSHRPGRPHFQ